MAETKYTRSISSDFTGLATGITVPSLAQLSKEIRSSTISIALNKCMKDGDSIEIYFADAIATAEETLLDQLIAAHTGLGIQATTNASGHLYVEVSGGNIQIDAAEGTEKIVGSIDFAKPTSWYKASLRHTETLVPVAGSSNLRWESPTGTKNWIDVVHGLALDEDDAEAVAPGGTYKVVINSGHTAAAPFEEEKWAGEDCWIDYENGELVFQTAPTTDPNVTYNYATTSEWWFEPLPGKVLSIEKVTAQFSVGAAFRGGLVFKIQMPDGQGGWTDLGGKFYKTRRQLQQDALGSFPLIKATTPDPDVSGKYDRGYSQDIEEIPFRYGYKRALDSAYGMRLYLRIDNDKPMLAESAVATFYCKSEDAV